VIEYLGPRIRERRLQLDMTQQELGAAVGCTKGMISQIERGKALPPIDTLLRIARELDVPVGYLTDP
jgi:transcriptional regulator with XRE-family HTH domain